MMFAHSFPMPFLAPPPFPFAVPIKIVPNADLALLCCAEPAGPVLDDYGMAAHPRKFCIRDIRADTAALEENSFWRPLLTPMLLWVIVGDRLAAWI
jgi:hypothetical protein